MYLTGLGTAVPVRGFSQAECLEALEAAPQFPQLKPRSRELLRKVLSADNGIAKRHFAVTALEEGFVLTPDALHARFVRHAPTLAARSAEQAMAKARLLPNEVDAVIVSTCTGYLCPGLSGHVIEALGLRPDIQALDLVGQGCGAALPNCRAASALLAAGQARHVLSVCVEVCSAAFYMDDDPGVLISACLFGDGAAAALWSARPSAHARRVEWTTAKSVVSPAERDSLRFEQRGGMLRNILSLGVPKLAARHAGTLLDEMLDGDSPTRTEVVGWILHAGGREVLAALQRRLGLTPEDLRPSTETLRDFGNLSSPFVFFVLDRALAQGAPGGWWWMCSFGAGFSCHGAFLKVD